MSEEILDQENYDDAGPEIVPDQVRGLSSEQVVEKLVKLEISEPTYEAQLKALMETIGEDPTPFLAMKPTREFMFAQTNPFDEFEVEGDFESSLILARMHPAFYGVSLTLFQMAIARLTLTRSRAGFQQKILRTVVNVNQSANEDKKQGRWAIPIFGRKG